MQKISAIQSVSISIIHLYNNLLEKQVAPSMNNARVFICSRNDQSSSVHRVKIEHKF